MLDEARKDVLERHAGLTMTYGSSGSDWRELCQPQQARPLDTVVLEDGVAEKLAADCKQFLTSGSWYRQRGIPHRRGILLHGPPGCGKTSVIVALAGHLGLGISILSLADTNMTDSSLQARIADVPRNTLLLLEDIDAAFVSREASTMTNTAHAGLSQVTLTGLLNALDGVVASEARLTFLTTNYPGRLDPALIRPGRVDVKQLIGWCSQQQIKRLFTKFFPEASGDQADSFCLKVLSGGRNISAAQIQTHLLLHKDDIKTAIEYADKVYEL